MAKFILDSGSVDEYKDIAQKMKDAGSELWGGTTNPSLIAKALAGKKVSEKEAFDAQKEIVLELLEIVPGAVSAEVYADNTTTAEQMTEQGQEIATWHERVVVKLPTTLEGIKARTILRREGVPINNTLVFSQQQVFIINLHEQLIQRENPTENLYPPFISPFVGRLDDRGENGMDVIKHALTQQSTYGFTPWVLASSIRRVEHIKCGLEYGVDLMTVPAKVYTEWLELSKDQQEALDSTSYANQLTTIDYWNPQEFLMIDSIDELINQIEADHLHINHPLTTAGIERFTEDWKAILT